MSEWLETLTEKMATFIHVNDAKINQKMSKLHTNFFLSAYALFLNVLPSFALTSSFE